MTKKFNNEPLVSVIMNCYNGEKYLKQSIESVLSQNYKNWELIFWDNKSEDKSAEILNSYKDIRIKYFCANKHTLLYEARNEAIKKTSGEFIAFLDTDDFWENDKLDLQIPLFEDFKVGVVYGNHFIINEILNTKRKFLKKKNPKGFILDSLLKNYCTSLVTLVIRKSFLNTYQPPFDSSFHIMGDFDLMIRMSTKYKFECVDKPIASYRAHGKNESILKKDGQIKELKRWLKKMTQYPIIFNNKNFSSVNQTLKNLEVTDLILKKNFKGAKLKVKEMPYSLKKIKYLIALILPYSLIKKFIQS